MKKSRFIEILTVAAIALSEIAGFSSCSSDRMSFKIDSKGMLSMTAVGKTQIAPSTLGMAAVGKTLYAPLSAQVSSDKVVLKFEQGDVTLSKLVRPNGSLRLEVTGIPDEIDTFIFGPYECPESVAVGEMVGACWHADGSLICIQSLNPKTVGQWEEPRDHFGIGSAPFTNNTGFTSPGATSAGISEGKYVLTCHADNFTRPRTVDVIGFQNVIAEPIPAPEGSIVGAAIILTMADSADAMLAEISDIEIEEGLPHPTIDGEWAKTSPHAIDTYFVFGGGDMDMQIRTVEKANVNWIYFSDPFQSWGHFNVNTNKYPGGDAQLRELADKARAAGAQVGMHTLSNFIHTWDEYVTPVPHKDLLAFDPTPIKNDLSITGTENFIGEQLNYANKNNLSIVRLGDELIQFDHFDAERMCLTGCKRGFYGTTAAAYPAGTILTHLSDHGYSTLFPNHALQNEMADNMADFINKFGMKRMSFDGLEGCLYTGHGEYGTNSYVKRVFDSITDHNIICESSTSSHYRWHAVTNFNWGEPWYDSDMRGGMYNYRARNVDYFSRNLLPGMLGWYKFVNSDRIYEPTLPETVEFMVSRGVAYGSGITLSWALEESAKADSFLQKIREWEEFRLSVKVPDEIRKRMMVERSDWHLEKDGDKWKLSEMVVQNYDLRYTDRMQTVIQKESGTSTDNPWSTADKCHLSNCVIDRGSTNKDIKPIVEPAHFRIRVGYPTEKGQLNGLAFCGGWYGGEILSFNVKAEAGEYLEYYGGTTLYHYDKDYNFIEKIEGKGREIVINGANLGGVSVKYALTNDDLAMSMRYIRTLQTFELTSNR